MRLLAQSPMVRPMVSPKISAGAQADVHPTPSPLISVRLLRAFAQLVERQGWVAFAAVSLVCIWIRLSNFASPFLGHDELYTYYIAQAPTLKQLLALTRTVDLHPPLSYLLIHTSFAIFGVSSWSCRLPSVLAFISTTVLLYWMVSRILSPLYGITSVLFVWCAPFSYPIDQARPYSLLLCFTALMLVSWYRAIENSDSTSGSGGRRFALLALAAGGFGLLLSHVLGVFSYVAFFVGELVRLSIRRKPDWTLWVALCVPTISALAYLPLIQTHSGILFTGEYRPTPMRIIAFYVDSIRFLTVPLASIALVVLLWPFLQRGTPRRQQQIASAPPAVVRRPLAILLCCLFLVPLGMGILFAHIGGAFFDRYGIVVLIPIALVPTLRLGFRTSRNHMAGMAVALVLSAAFLFNTCGKIWLIEQLGNLAAPRIAGYVLTAFALPPLLYEPVKPMVAPHLQKALDAAPRVNDLDDIQPGLPLVANTGLTFLEIDHRASPQLASRLYLLSDRQAAASIAHDTVFENYDRLSEVFPIRGHIEPYCAFLSSHPRFLALGAYNHPQGWLLKRLDRDGADLQIIATYAGITEEAQLYEITALKAACPTMH